MIGKHLQTAWRGLIKNPLYSLINMGGLGVALCACMLIVFYLVHEYHFDRFHTNGDRIYSVYGKSKEAAPGNKFETMSYATGPLLQASSPSVESFTRISLFPGTVFLKDAVHPDRVFKPTRPLFADSNFFTTFSFRLLEGSPSQVLRRPFCVVLSKTLATAYFGKENPIGKRLIYNEHYTLEVTGVSADPPSNAYLNFDAVCSLSSFESMADKDWIKQDVDVQPGNFKTYVLLKKAGDTRGLERTLDGLADHPRGDSVWHSFFAGYRYFVNPLTQEHLTFSLGRSAHQDYLKVFSLVAALILCLALINYMSMATARAVVRAREVGVRKTLGAGRKGLALQFYVESGLCTGLAFVLGLVLFYLTRPLFFGALHVTVDNSFLYTFPVLGSFCALLAGTVMLAGSYPALVLSSFRPVDTLTGRMSAHGGGQTVRKVLTVLQFTIATGMIATLWVMKDEVYFFLHKDIGMNRDNVVMIPFGRELGRHHAAFKSDIAALPGITAVATTDMSLFGGIVQESLDAGSYKGKNIPISSLWTDSSFLPLMQIHWKLRPSDAFWSSDPHAIVINEMAVKTLNLPPDPRGQRLPFTETDQPKIVGVVKDFAYTSLTFPLGALCIHPQDTAWRAGGCLLARVAPGANLPALLDAMQTTYKRYPAEEPFTYQFCDEAFNRMYQSQDRMARLLSIGAFIAIGIACLGLLGLAIFSTARRTKEIGIRKVLGAGVPVIVRLLTTDFLILVGLAVLVATPLAWWVSHVWLQQFATRIAISPWILVCSGLGMVLLALLTVGGQAIKAARANPVDNLRSE
jgi:putative ABC transport system permease protein